jgi:thymidylate synthase (FAD)
MLAAIARGDFVNFVNHGTPPTPATGIIGREARVHQHGFIRVVDVMGDDRAVVDAARVSYQQGTTTSRSDRSLIRYLMRHRHTSPFEMCEIKLHIKLPIFVARQWIRQRTASVNEVSGRYSILPTEYYLPSHDAVAKQSNSNKQGRGEAVADDAAFEVVDSMADACDVAFATYQDLVADDVARELARITLPLSTYTEWYWKIDLHNLLNFLSQRLDSHAQQEIRDYARPLAAMVEAWVPHTWEAFVDYRLNAVTLSRSEVEELRRLVAENHLTAFDVRSVGSDRENEAFCRMLGMME